MRKFGSGFMALMFVIGLVIVGPATASAAGWAQEFNESGIGPFDAMEFFMVSGPAFNVPALYGFSESGWTGSLVNPMYALATKDTAHTGSSTNVNLYLAFSGDTSQTFTFDFFAYNQGHQVDKAEATWNGGWSIVGTFPERVYDRTDPPVDTAVPEPATLLLLGFGLVGMGFFRERKFSLKK